MCAAASYSACYCWASLASCALMALVRCRTWYSSFALLSSSEDTIVDSCSDTRDNVSARQRRAATQQPPSPSLPRLPPLFGTQVHPLAPGSARAPRASHARLCMHTSSRSTMVALLSARALPSSLRTSHSASTDTPPPPPPPPSSSAARRRSASAARRSKSPSAAASMARGEGGAITSTRATACVCPGGRAGGQTDRHPQRRRRTDEADNNDEVQLSSSAAVC